MQEQHVEHDSTQTTEIEPRLQKTPKAQIQQHQKVLNTVTPITTFSETKLAAKDQSPTNTPRKREPVTILIPR